MFKVDLRQLIVLLAFSSSVVTLAYTLFGTYQAERELLIDNTLESNHAYAAKLAGSTDALLENLQQQLAYSASVLAQQMESVPALAAEAKRLKLQNKSFNSVLIVDQSGFVQANSPPDLGLLGTLLDSVGARQALALRQALISPPYVTQTNRLVIFMSHPITSWSGKYLGYVGGSIYLHEANSLNMLLGEHYHRDGSQIYVVDQSRRLIYHQNTERVGEFVANNMAIEEVVKGNSGQAQLVNSKGISMLAGYAASKKANWGIVVQRPTEVVLHELDKLLQKAARNTIPFYLVTALLIWWLSRQIAQPLWQLARTAPNLDSPHTQARIERVRAWYFEAEQIKKALLVGLQRLSKKMGRMDQERNTDPLTGLLNRRGMDQTLQQWQKQQVQFAVLACDIDHFKIVNDTHGHDVGDLVLQFLAATMRAETRKQDLLCRVGGEEFLIFLPELDTDAAYQAAERLRLAVSQTESPSGSAITISIGIAHWPSYSSNLAVVLKGADQALYSAKRNGRNRTQLAEFEPQPSEL